jgi:hypothetical protein
MGANAGADKFADVPRTPVQASIQLAPHPAANPQVAMEKSVHPFSELFAQLGLPADEASIRQFIVEHSPLPDAMRLEEAPFWSPSQAALLREERIDDADWIVTIDQLNIALHATP